MDFTAKKTILLEKQYLYVRASSGFYLEGCSSEKIPVHNGFYRFLVDNLEKTLGNSYVIVHYMENDLSFDAYCTDLFLEEIQNTIVVSVENLGYLLDFHLKKQDDADSEIVDLLNGLGGVLSPALETINDNVVHDKNAVDEFARVNHIDSLAINKSLTDVKNAVVSQSSIAGLTDVKDAVNTMSSGLSGALQTINQNVINDKGAVDEFARANHIDALAINKSLTDVKNAVVSQSSVAGLADVKDAVNTMSSGLSGALQTINQNVINDKNAVDEFARANHIDVLAINKSLTDVKNSVVSQSPIAGLTDVKDAVNTMSSGLSGALQIINQNVINDKNAINQLSAANHADLVALLTAFNVLSQDLKKKFEMIINGFIRVGAFAKHIDLLSEGSSFSLSGLERFVTYSIRFRSFSLIVPSDVKIFVVSTNVDSSYSVGQLVGNIYTGVTLNATSWQGTYDDITIVINLI